jgi:hypothetical protein
MIFLKMEAAERVEVLAVVLLSYLGPQGTAVNRVIS